MASWADWVKPGAFMLVILVLAIREEIFTVGISDLPGFAKTITVLVLIIGLILVAARLVGAVLPE